LRGARGG